MKSAWVLSNPSTVAASASAAARHSLLDRADWRNIAWLLLGFSIILALIPPVRSYPMGDDWAYSQSVSRLLNFTYTPHDGAQPSSIGHLVLAVPLALAFGDNFNVLTIVTLIMSALCLVIFYILLRHLDVTTRCALLGTALLALNPMYVYLTYSFMTDITFMAYLLAGCLFFVRGAQGHGHHWFWLGSVATALAYLTRQHGIVLVPAIVIYLWWSRKLSLRTTIACIAIPLATVAVFMLWERNQPPQIVSHMVSDTMQAIFANPGKFLLAQMQRFTLVAMLPGLCLLPFFSLPRRVLLVVPFLAFFLFFQFRSLLLYGTLFPEFGNLVDHTGFVMYIYDRPILWSESIWAILGVLGGFSFAFFLANCVQAAADWLRVRPWRDRPRNADPSLLVYLSGILLAVVTLLSPFLFDRYFLPLMPVIILLPLRRLSLHIPTPVRKNTPVLLLSWLALLTIALFSLLALRDYKAEATVRWQMAEKTASQGIPREKIDAGFEWLGWYLFQKGANYIHSTNDYKEASFAAAAVSDPVYLVNEMLRPGYTQIGVQPYDSWLSGGQTRTVLLTKRDNPSPSP